jgi:hypothetical protein
VNASAFAAKPTESMSLFTEVDAFLARAYPGSRLAKDSPFLQIKTPNYRKLVSRNEQNVANELLRESCWLVTVGEDPRPLLSAVDAIEQRASSYTIDYGKEESDVQWVVRVRGRVDLEAIRAKVGLAMTLLIAPVSERMIDHQHLSLFASSAADLERAVAEHPESFKPSTVR